ncbi:MAG: ABC transporter ATP-binding protein [Anaerolineales bacterium]
MLKLFPYIRQYTLPILAAILLLFLQANADLTLPDYLSKIVNEGIQQGGVENAVPAAMRAETYRRMNFFLTADEQTLVAQAYQQVDSTSSKYANYQKDYPALNGEPVYVLLPQTPAQIDALIPVVGRGLLTVSFLEQAQADPEKAAAMGQNMGFDLSKLPPGMSLFDVLDKIPADQRAEISTAIQESFATLGDSLVGQMGIAAAKAEYEDLGVDMATVQSNYILRTGAIMLLITLLSVTATILVGLISARVAAGVARDLRAAIFRRVSEFAGAEIEKFSTASLITRATNDVNQLQMMTMMTMRMVFYAPIVGFGGLIRALDTAPSMWWIIALMVTILVGLIISVFTVSLPRFKRIQTLIDNLNRVVRENLSGMMVVRAFNRQQVEEQRFDKANRDLTENTLFVSRVMVILMPVMMFLMSSVSLLVIWVGAYQIDQSQMQVGDMMAFMQYTMQIFFAFMFMSMMFIILPRASVSADRIADVLGTQPSIVDVPNAQHFAQPFRGEVEFRNVSFHYPDAEEDVLHQISFVARPGETTAFIGTTGSGKSTIVRLIPRFYDVTGGAILIDGVDIRQIPQAELRDKIGYVPQRSNLFTGSIESNLRFGGENASEQELLHALEIAQGKEILATRPEGLAAEIAQGGTNVSGGQRQRLAIARALVKRAPIYIFDDSFSALDFKTDAALRRALKKYVADSTVFIVSQRVATIKSAEQIIVLDEGRIVGKGTHHELMESNQVYRDIALSQLSQEELA